MMDEQNCKIDLLWNVTDKRQIISDDPNVVRWGFAPVTTDAWRILLDPATRYLNVGGAKGGAKTWYLSRVLMLLSWMIIEQFQLEPQDDPRKIIPIGFFCRRRSTDFTKTTLARFKMAVDPRLYEIKEQKKEIIVGGAVKWDYGGLDDPGAITKLNSGEYGTVMADQAEELTREMHGHMVGTQRLVIQGVPIPLKSIYSCNPADCFLRPMFVENEKKLERGNSGDPEYRFVQFLATDNPFRHPDYIKNLKNAWKHRPEILAALVYGSWDALGGVDTFISYADVIACTSLDIAYLLNNPKWRAVSADIAREGNDKTVFIAWEGYRQIAKHTIGKCDHKVAAEELVKFANKYEANYYYIEDDPYGNPVIVEVKDLVRTGKEKVIGIKPGSTDVLKEELFVNVRAEMWYTAGRLISERKVSLLDDEDIRNQLSTVKYRHASGERLLAEKKEDYKKREGESPDDGDATVIGLYGMERYKPSAPVKSPRPYGDDEPDDDCPELINFSKR